MGIKFSNWGLGLKLAIVFGLVLFFTSGIVFLGLYGIGQMKIQYEQNSKTIAVISEIQYAREDEKEFQLKHEPDAAKSVAGHIQSSIIRIDELSANLVDQDITRMLSGIKTLVKQYETNFLE